VGMYSARIVVKNEESKTVKIFSKILSTSGKDLYFTDGEIKTKQHL